MRSALEALLPFAIAIMLSVCVYKVGYINGYRDAQPMYVNIEQRD